MLRTKKLRATLWACCAAVLLVGCGGGSSVPGGNGKSGTFFSGDMLLRNDQDQVFRAGRPFITLSAGKPTAIGFELDPQGLQEFLALNLGFDQPVVLFASLPPEATVTPFKQMMLLFFDAHGPIGVGDVPHFHPLILRQGPRLPSNPPLEEVPVAPAEVPTDHGQFSGAVVPGVGDAYDDPEEPPAKPGWNTVGYNYLFYNGHMNAISNGATEDFLLSRQTGGNIIKQPQLYPEPGYYPHFYRVYWDAARQVHVFSWEDWRYHDNAVSQ